MCVIRDYKGGISSKCTVNKLVIIVIVFYQL